MSYLPIVGWRSFLVSEVWGFRYNGLLSPLQWVKGFHRSRPMGLHLHYSGLRVFIVASLRLCCSISSSSPRWDFVCHNELVGFYHNGPSSDRNGSTSPSERVRDVRHDDRSGCVSSSSEPSCCSSNYQAWILAYHPITSWQSRTMDVRSWGNFSLLIRLCGLFPALPRVQQASRPALFPWVLRCAERWSYRRETERLRNVKTWNTAEISVARIRTESNGMELSMQLL